MYVGDLHITVENAEETPEIIDICPICQERVTFLPINGHTDVRTDYFGDFMIFQGHRQCSNPNCKMIFAIELNCKIVEYWKRAPFSEEWLPPEQELEPDSLETFPNQFVKPFSFSIPDFIKKTFDEAIRSCSVKSYEGAASMIRKTLENICKYYKINECNLKLKLDKLLEQENIKGIIDKDIHELRKICNDAVHSNTKYYDNIDETDIRICIKALHSIICLLFGSYKDEYKKHILDLKKRKRKRR